MQINIEEREAKAKALFAQGYNCSQAVFLAYADCFDLDPTLAATIAAPFGGGMGRMREVCGAVSGMALIAGLKYPMTDPKDREAKNKNYELVKNAGTAFEQTFGSMICRELLDIRKGTQPEIGTDGHPVVKPGKCSCSQIVQTAARIIGEKLNQSPETPQR
ncbi:MAG: C-GCAxxG-C-C family protein [Bacteroidales bacterium]